MCNESAAFVLFAFFRKIWILYGICNRKTSDCLSVSPENSSSDFRLLFGCTGCPSRRIQLNSVSVWLQLSGPLPPENRAQQLWLVSELVHENSWPRTVIQIKTVLFVYPANICHRTFLTSGYNSGYKSR
jgi:hypothetical protein